MAWTTPKTFVAGAVLTAAELNTHMRDNLNHLFDSIDDVGTLFNIASKTAAYTATTADTVLLCDASSGAFTLTLPAASGNAGLYYLIKKIDSSANAITIDANGSETIDGATTYVSEMEDQAVLIVCDGSNWETLSHTANSLLNVVSKTSAYTASATVDQVILCDASSAAFTLTLPAASSNAGVYLYIKKIDSSANAVTIDGNASETIDGATTFVVNYEDQAVVLACDGTNWETLARTSTPVSAMALIAAATPASGTISMSSLTTTDYDALWLVVTGLESDTDQDEVEMQLNATTAGYHYADEIVSETTIEQSFGAGNAGSIKLLSNSVGARRLGNAADEGAFFSVWIDNDHHANEFLVFYQGSYVDADGRLWSSLGGSGWVDLGTATSITQIDIKATTGNLDAGTARLYGLRKAAA